MHIVETIFKLVSEPANHSRASQPIAVTPYLPRPIHLELFGLESCSLNMAVHILPQPVTLELGSGLKVVAFLLDLVWVEAARRRLVCPQLKAACGRTSH